LIAASPETERELIPRRRLERGHRRLRAGRTVQPERVAERADALRGGPEILRERLQRGGVVRLRGLIARVDVAGGLLLARLNAGDLGLRRVVGAAEEI
jgi:hypothetical protein